MPMSMVVGLGIVIVALIFAIRFIQTSSKVSKVETTKGGSTDDGKKIDNKVALNPKADTTYVINCLRPTSTPLDILYAICTSPDNVAVTSKHLALRADLYERKVAHLKKEKEAKDTKPEANLDDLFDDDGWAEEDENDEAAKKAAKAKEEKEKAAQALARATGRDAKDVTKVKLEGLDEGVLGQEWVKSHLEDMGAWPPPNFDDALISTKKFKLDNNGATEVAPLDHPAIARNILMTMGRLNARQLNNHPELMEAGPKQLVDPTYFQQTMEYRQRVARMLDGILRMACTLRSYRLACSVLDAIVMFKIGLMDINDQASLAWFTDIMTKQYTPAGMPRLIIDERYLGVPTPSITPNKPDGTPKTDAEKKEEEKNRITKLVMQTKEVTTTDEKMALEIQITRAHAEMFTKVKVAQCKAQGIPPQLALQAYRESWFILVRARKVNDDGSTDTTWDGALNARDSEGKLLLANHMEHLRLSKNSLYEMLEGSTTVSFMREFDGDKSVEDLCSRKIVIGWPFGIANMAQKTGRVKIHIPPPTVEGTYEFSVTVKSQDFLGVGQEFTLTVDVAKGVEPVVESKKEK